MGTVELGDLLGEALGDPVGDVGGADDENDVSAYFVPALGAGAGHPGNVAYQPYPGAAWPVCAWQSQQASAAPDVPMAEPEAGSGLAVLARTRVGL